MTTCQRKAYYHEDAAANAAAKADKGYFRCAWCGDWHTGWDPGPVAPCYRCGTLITIPERGTPKDAARGWAHHRDNCDRAIRAA
jgi:hypothetical protein